MLEISLVFLANVNGRLRAKWKNALKINRIVCRIKLS